jgi:hypothetical protein
MRWCTRAGRTTASSAAAGTDQQPKMASRTALHRRRKIHAGGPTEGGYGKALEGIAGP